MQERMIQWANEGAKNHTPCFDHLRRWKEKNRFYEDINPHTLLAIAQLQEYPGAIELDQGQDRTRRNKNVNYRNQLYDICR